MNVTATLSTLVFAGGMVLSGSAFAQASVQYTVLQLRIWELADELNEHAGKGWRLRELTTRTNCRFPSALKQEEIVPECFIAVMESNASPGKGSGGRSK